LKQQFSPFLFSTQSSFSCILQRLFFSLFSKWDSQKNHFPFIAMKSSSTTLIVSKFSGIFIDQIIQKIILIFLSIKTKPNVFNLPFGPYNFNETFIIIKILFLRNEHQNYCSSCYFSIVDLHSTTF